MSFPGKAHVGLPRQDEPGRSTREVRDQSAGQRRDGRLGFLSPERSPHGRCFDHHLMHPETQHRRGDGLNFGGILGRAQEANSAGRIRLSPCRLGLQIAVLLSPGGQHALESVVGAFPGSGDVSALDLFLTLEELPPVESVVQGQHRLFLVDLEMH